MTTMAVEPALPFCDPQEEAMIVERPSQDDVDIFISKKEDEEEEGLEEPPLELLDSSSSSSSSSGSVDENEEEEAQEVLDVPSKQRRVGGVSFFRAFFQTDTEEDQQETVTTTKDNESNEDATTATTKEEEEEVEIDPETRALNAAFLSLETMRKAHLEFAYCDGVIPGLVGRDATEYCTACLEDAKDFYGSQQQQQQQQPTDQPTNSYSRWSTASTRLQSQWKNRRRCHPKKAKHPCLVCASPVCKAHACQEFRQEGGIHICQSCSHLFTADFVLQTLHDKDNNRREQLARIMDAYDRAYIMLHYSAQFLDDIATSLEHNTKTSDKMGVGSSSMGIVSGITGVGAVAAQAAAAIHLAAAATILTPVGPPLLVASILFGGTAASAALGTEAVSYYSEPNQLANKILALSHLVHSLWAVTNILKEALQLQQSDQDIQDIVEKMYCRQSRRILRRQSSSTLATTVVAADDDATTTTTTAASVEDNKDNDEAITSVAQQRATTTTILMMNHQSSSNLSVLSESAHDEDDDVEGGDDADKEAVDDEEVKQEESTKEEQEESGCDSTTLSGEQEALKEDAGESEETNGESNVNKDSSSSNTDAEEDNEGGEEPIIPEKGSTLSAAMPLAPFIDDAVLSVCKIFSAPTSGGGSAVAASRVTSNAMKVAQFATVACGALSAATIVMESNNFNRALKSLKAGSPCEKAQMLRNVKEELKQLPDTKEIAAECEMYLQATTTTTMSSTSSSSKKE